MSQAFLWHFTPKIILVPVIILVLLTNKVEPDENWHHWLGRHCSKAYLPVITQIPNVELVFCTRNANVLSALAQQYRIAETCQDYQQLVGMGVDAVMIHAATSVHPQIASFF